MCTEIIDAIAHTRSFMKLFVWNQDRIRHVMCTWLPGHSPPSWCCDDAQFFRYKSSSTIFQAPAARIRRTMQSIVNWTSLDISREIWFDHVPSSISLIQIPSKQFEKQQQKVTLHERRRVCRCAGQWHAVLSADVAATPAPPTARASWARRWRIPRSSGPLLRWNIRWKNFRRAA